MSKERHRRRVELDPIKPSPQFEWALWESIARRLEATGPRSAAVGGRPGRPRRREWIPMAAAAGVLAAVAVLVLSDRRGSGGSQSLAAAPLSAAPPPRVAPEETPAGEAPFERQREPLEAEAMAAASPARPPDAPAAGAPLADVLRFQAELRSGDGRLLFYPLVTIQGRTASGAWIALPPAAVRIVDGVLFVELPRSALDGVALLRLAAGGWSSLELDPEGLQGQRLSLTVEARHRYGGRVVDAGTGLPVPGAFVRYLSPEQVRLHRAGLEGARAVEIACPGELTGTDGAFLGLTDFDGEHALVAACPGYVPRQIEGVRPDARSGLPAEVALRRGSTIQGTVAAAAGLPSGDLLLSMGAMDPGLDLLDLGLGERARVLVQTGAGGAFSASGFEPARPDGTPTRLWLALAGRVRDGAALARAPAWVSQAGLEESVAPALDCSILAVAGELPGPGGGVAVPWPASGDVALAADYREIHAAVYNSLGAPEAGARVSVRASQEPLGAVDAVTDPGGSASFLAPPALDLALQATAGDGRASGQLLHRVNPQVPGEQVWLVLDDGQAAALQLELRDSAGAPVTQGRWSLGGGADPWRPAAALTREAGQPEGSFTVHLPPGPHRLRIFGPLGDETLGFAEFSVDLAAGDRYARDPVVLPRGAVLEIRIPCAVVGPGAGADTPRLEPSGESLAVEVAGAGGLVCAEVANGLDPALEAPLELVTRGSADSGYYRVAYLRQRLPAGLYTVRLSLEGWAPDEQQISVGAGEGLRTVVMNVRRP